jgi:hypothetical protein
MKARPIMVSSFALLACTALAAPATAAPPGAGLETVPVTCDDDQTTTVTVSAGASFWLGEQHYVLTSFAVTFTPAGGGDPEMFSKTYGQRRGLAGDEITCTATLEEPGEGTAVIVATGVPVP